MTNTIRPIVAASLLVIGEAQDGMDSERTLWSAGGIQQIGILGQWEFWAYEGKKRVEISASKIIPGSKTRGAGGEPVPDEYLPERYKAMIELKATVTTNDHNRIDFQLSSKKDK